MKIQNIYNQISGEIDEIMFNRGFEKLAEDYLSYVAETIHGETIELAISVKTDSLRIHTEIRGESGGMVIDNYHDILDDDKFITIVNEVAI